MSDIPDGADTTVAKMAIAWEIAKDAMRFASETRGGAIETDNGRTDVYTELFNKAYHALLDRPDES